MEDFHPQPSVWVLQQMVVIFKLFQMVVIFKLCG